MKTKVFALLVLICLLTLATSSGSKSSFTAPESGGVITKEAPEPAASPQPLAENLPYCASKKSDVFHYCSCQHVARIKPENLIRFKTCEEARASGRRPCKVCRPCS